MTPLRIPYRNPCVILRAASLLLFMLFAYSGGANAETNLPVPDNAIQVECRQEFKDLQTRFYQYILITFDNDIAEVLEVNLADQFSSWSGSALVYLQNENDIRRLVNKVDFFQDGNGAYISGMEGYRYGSLGVGSNNGIFVEYETREELGNAIFDRILGCYILR